MAPDLQEATHRPHPLQSTGFISAIPVFSLNPGAEKGQIATQTPQLLQKSGFTTATTPLVLMIFCASNVTAREAAACAWAMDSSMGCGEWARPQKTPPSVAKINWPEFYMGLNKETIFVYRYLKELR